MDANIGDILDDLQADMVPPDASTLSAKQLAEELIQRNLKPTGFPEDDIKLLQKHLNAEFEAEKEQKLKERKEALLRRRAEEDANRMQKFLEKQKAEEEDALSKDNQMVFNIELLQHNRTPADMILRGAPIAIRAFIKAITATNNTSLKSLDLCQCFLGDDVGIEIGTCIKMNKHIQRIELDFNNLGPKSLTAIAVGLQNNTTLKSLSIEHNPLTGIDPVQNIDLSGYVALSEALKKNNTLLTLNLFQTGISHAGGKLLCEGVVGGENEYHIPLHTECHLHTLQCSNYDGIHVFDMDKLTNKIRDTGHKHYESIRHSKIERAKHRLMDEEKIAKQYEEEKAKLEAEWIEKEKASRKAARDAADFDAYRAERMAMLEREVAEKQRKQKLAEEAAAKEKKAKK